MELVFYVPGQPWVIDFAHICGGVVVSQLYNQTLDEVKKIHPGATVVSFQEAAAQIHAGHRGQPRPIHQDDYKFARRIVFGKIDGSQAEGESFKVPDFGADALSQVYACYNGTYWVFEEDYNLPHETVIDRVRQAMSIQ
ncbi:hypothetical protein K5D42_25075 [Pseudomonas cichorii]|nr:hypothetical protein [Pseudomonas cichorii]MBX8493146.1 hypothetical protein [Pseudomonas cichorii]